MSEEILKKEHFAAISLLVEVRRNDPDKMSADAAAFRNQSAYKTMTKYLWAKCSEEYELRINKFFELFWTFL